MNDRTVYVATRMGILGLNALTGSTLWSTEGEFGDFWGASIANDLVYVYVPGRRARFEGYETNGGALRFSVPDPRPSISSFDFNQAPALGNNNEAVVRHRKRLLAFDVHSGSVRWEVADFADETEDTRQVSVADGVVYAANDTSIQARKSLDGTLLWSWQVPDNTAVSHTMIATQNLLFAGLTGHFDMGTTAIELATGQKIWHHPASGYLALSSADGILLISSEERLVALAVR